MQDDNDEHFMRRAIRLAMNGRGRVEPNPMVGCVIVKDGRVVGQGFHQQFGGPHAEPTALASCSESPEGATAYVTLEPCSHVDKKTPPCAPRLIEAKIARVVIGCLDPNPQVNGHGARMLRAAGMTVDVPPRFEAEARQLIAPFISGMIHHRPYVTAKWAQSANGQVAGPKGKRVHLTNAVSDRVVHQLRARCDAIAVGTNTVLNDDPLLTARDVETHRPLVRVVLSNSLKIPTESRLVQSARQHPLVVYSSDRSVEAQPEVMQKLSDAGVKVIALPTKDERRFSFSDVLADLYQLGITHLLIEPGPTLCRYLLARGQADRIWVFHCPKTIEDAQGFGVSKAPAVAYPVTGSIDVKGDRLVEHLNPSSTVFFANTPSADLTTIGVSY